MCVYVYDRIYDRLLQSLGEPHGEVGWTFILIDMWSDEWMDEY